MTTETTEQIQKENEELIKLTSIDFYKRTPEQTRRIYELIGYKQDKKETTEQKLAKLQNMEANHYNYMADSVTLKKLRNTILRTIPNEFLVNHLKGRKSFNKKWTILQK